MLKMLKENFDSNTISFITITYKHIPIAHEHDDKHFKNINMFNFFIQLE
jgi:hypothetical protein